MAAGGTSCPSAASALARAQSAWHAFYNGDFVDAAARAEAQFQLAKTQLSLADRSASKCNRDDTALERAELHFEIDVVDARRARGSTASLQRVASDLATMRRLGLERSNPDRYRADIGRFREVQAETRGALVIPPPVSPPMQAPVQSCSGIDVPPHPNSPIAPAVPSATSVRRPHGATGVTVVIGPQGNVLSALTTQSSGDPALDQAVLGAVRLVTWSPALAGCRPVQGEYRFTYTFPQF